MSSTQRASYFFVALSSFWISSVCVAEVNVDYMKGFDDFPATEPVLNSTHKEEIAPKSISDWQHVGSINLASSYNYIDHRSDTGVDYQGWSKMRMRLNIQSDKKLSEDWKLRISGYAYYDAAYSLRDRSRYDEKVLTDYEIDANTQDLWIQGKIRNELDAKLGRQVEIWGRSENIRITDVINPLDNLEPGLVDIEDIRLPVTMAKLNFYSGPWGISGIWLPEVRFSKSPPQGSDFSLNSTFPSPYAAAVNLPDIDEKKPDGIENYAAAINGVFSGWDISFYWARLWQDTPILGGVTVEEDLNTPQSLTPQIVLEHQRYTMMGSAGSLARKGWVLFYEFAAFRDYCYNEFLNHEENTSIPQINVRGHNRLDVLFGLEYFGISDASISLELANRHISGHRASMRDFSVAANQMETALRFQRFFLNERWLFLAIALWYGERAQYGSIYRTQLTYELTDSLDFTGGVLWYEPGEEQSLFNYEHNDRIFFNMKYSF